MAALGKEAVVGVAGAGVMGSSIAQVVAAAGHPVLLWDVVEGASCDAKEKIADELSRRVAKGNLEPAEREATLARISPCKLFEDLRSSALLLEAILEDLDSKQSLFREIESRVAESAILASNTSSLSITAIASALKDPIRFAGLHFFNPATAMQLVEVVGGMHSSEAVLQTLCDTAREWGKTPVRSKSAPGFIVNKGARPYYGEPLRFAEEGGADFATIDALLKSIGFRMGPFQLIDLVGLDVNLSVSESMWAATFGEDRYKPSPLVIERVAAGLLGKKTGEGFYRYPGESPSETILPPMAAPTEIEIKGGLGPASELVDLLQGAGLQVAASDGDGTIHIDGAKLALSDGRLAADRNCALFDLVLSWEACSHVAVTSAKGCDSEEARKAAGLFQALGKQVSFVEDLPGMLSARTVAMLVNEACDTVLKGTATCADVDVAMTLGLNFPGGPLSWCDALGADYCLSVLDNMAACYGEDRYRASVLLRRQAATGAKFHA